MRSVEVTCETEIITIIAVITTQDNQTNNSQGRMTKEGIITITTEKTTRMIVKRSSPRSILKIVLRSLSV